DAADELPDAPLALRRSYLATEVFRDDDVGRLLRPEPGNLDVALLEHDFAPLVSDNSGAQLPFDLIERIDAGLAEKPRKGQPGRGRRRPRFHASVLDARRAKRPADT